jgi:adenine deaminase
MFTHNPSNRDLVEVALGRKPADMVIRDGVLLDVYTGRMLPGRSVAIWDKWIAYVGPDAAFTMGEDTLVVDADQRIISPGYIDSHTHVSAYWDTADFLKYAIPGGTTTLITEVENFGFALGAAGFRAYLDQVGNRPIKFYCLVPPMVTISTAARPYLITPAECRDLLRDERVIGLGESYWQSAIIEPDDRVLSLIREALAAGKTAEGHAAGAYEKRLAAYAAAGALSCHEAVSTEDVLSRLELGYFVQLREGYIRRDLEIILPLKDEIDLRRVSLSTDGTSPELLIRGSYLYDVVQKAVDLGVEPVTAVQMVSINPAEHFGLSYITGGIAPGRFADILLLPKLDVMKPDLVISEGRIIAEGGKAVVSLSKRPYPEDLFHTVSIDPLPDDSLAVPLSALGSGGEIRTMDIQPGGLVTREGKAKITSVNGEVSANPEQDVLKIVFVEKVSGRGEKFIGFIKGWGQKRGAVATSACWDASGIIAIGENDHDLVRAINQVIDHQGGTVLSVNGELLVDLPFKIGGYISEHTIEDLASELTLFRKRTHELGSTLESPHLTLVTLTSAAIPFIRMSEQGYFRFRENDYVGL